jgi:hypothetical protein
LDRIDHHIYELKGNHTMFRTEPSVLGAYNCTQLFEVDIPETPGVHKIEMVVGEESTDVPLQFTTSSGDLVPSSVYCSNATPDNFSFRLWARNAPRAPRQEAAVSFYEGNKPRVVQAHARRHELAGWTWVSAAMIDQKDEARNRLLARHYLFEDVELKPGNTLDLGDVRMDELREWKPE